MHLLKKFFLLFFASLLIYSCFEDFDDHEAFANEINDFVWKGNESDVFIQTRN